MLDLEQQQTIASLFMTYSIPSMSHIIVDGHILTALILFVQIHISMSNQITKAKCTQKEGMEFVIVPTHHIFILLS